MKILLEPPNIPTVRVVEQEIIALRWAVRCVESNYNNLSETWVDIFLEAPFNSLLVGFPSKFSLNEIHSFLFKTFVNFDVFSLKFSTSFSRKFRPFLRNFRSIKFNFKNERKFSFSFTLRCLNEIFAKEIERKFGNSKFIVV